MHMDTIIEILIDKGHLSSVLIFLASIEIFYVFSLREKSLKKSFDDSADREKAILEEIHLLTTNFESFKVAFGRMEVDFNHSKDRIKELTSKVDLLDSRLDKSEKEIIDIKAKIK